MGKQFTELVLAGSRERVKGFLLGFRNGTTREFDYYFHHKSGIQRDTLGEFMKEVLELENLIHVCIEDDMVEPFARAVAKATPLIGIEVKEHHRIKSARFNFSFNIYSRRVAMEMKQILNDLPPGVALMNYAPLEEERPVNPAELSMGYAPLQVYFFKGEGRIEGDFAVVIQAYQDLKRARAGEVVLLDDIVLELEGSAKDRVHAARP